MPLFIGIKDIQWNETEQKLNIIVPLSSRVDVKPSILVSSKYLKVSSTPYIWECFLASSIDPENSIVRIGDDAISFELKKMKAEIWENLTDLLAGNESYRKGKREEAFEEHKKYLESVSEMKQKKQREIQNATIRKQMELDDLDRKSAEKRKKEEQEKFIAAMKKKEEQLKANKIGEKRKSILQKSQQIPETRKSGHIKVNFTPRAFPTAARESQEPEEKEWLEKQLAANLSLKLDLEDLSPDEKNPQWLKSKAESMVKNGDFKSAINACNLAVRMCPNLFSLYSIRATCHLNLRNLHKAIEDSTKALELLLPPVSSNASARIEALKIRGTAFQMLELPVQALIEFEAALKIKPDEDLEKKVEMLRNYIGKDPGISEDIKR